MRIEYKYGRVYLAMYKWGRALQELFHGAVGSFGFALAVLGLIALVVLLYTGYVLNNPTELFLWILVVVSVIIGAAIVLLTIRHFE